jgi:hypothetical protein
MDLATIIKGNEVRTKEVQSSFVQASTLHYLSEIPRMREALESLLEERQNPDVLLNPIRDVYDVLDDILEHITEEQDTSKIDELIKSVKDLGNHVKNMPAPQVNITEKELVIPETKFPDISFPEYTFPIDELVGKLAAVLPKPVVVKTPKGQESKTTTIIQQMPPPKQEAKEECMSWRVDRDSKGKIERITENYQTYREVTEFSSDGSGTVTREEL